MTDAMLPAIASLAVATGVVLALSLTQHHRAARHARDLADREEFCWRGFIANMRKERAISIEVDVFPQHGILRIAREGTEQIEAPIMLDDVARISSNVVRSPFPILIRKRPRGT